MFKVMLIALIISAACMGISIGIQLSKNDSVDYINGDSDNSGNNARNSPKQLTFVKPLLWFCISWIIIEIIFVMTSATETTLTFTTCSTPNRSKSRCIRPQTESCARG